MFLSAFSHGLLLAMPVLPFFCCCRRMFRLCTTLKLTVYGCDGRSCSSAILGRMLEGGRTAGGSCGLLCLLWHGQQQRMLAAKLQLHHRAPGKALGLCQQVRHLGAATSGLREQAAQRSSIICLGRRNTVSASR